MGLNFRLPEQRIVSDYVFQPNIQLQAKIIEAEASNQQLYNDLLAFNPDIKINGLSIDKSRVEAIQKKFDENVTKLSKDFQADPQNPKNIQNLRAFETELKNSLTSGEWKSITDRLTTTNDWLEKNKDLEKDDPITYNLLYSHYIKGLEKDKDKLFSTALGTAYTGIDLAKINSIKANTSVRTERGHDIKTEQVTPNDVLSVVVTDIASDPVKQAYLLQMKDLGLYDGKALVDDKGEMNKDHPYYAEALEAIATGSYKDVTKTANAYAITNYRHQLDLEKQQRSFDERVRINIMEKTIDEHGYGALDELYGKIPDITASQTVLMQDFGKLNNTPHMNNMLLNVKNSADNNFEKKNKGLLNKSYNGVTMKGYIDYLTSKGYKNNRGQLQTYMKNNHKGIKIEPAQMNALINGTTRYMLGLEKEINQHNINASENAIGTINKPENKSHISQLFDPSKSHVSVYKVVDNKLVELGDDETLTLDDILKSRVGIGSTFSSGTSLVSTHNDNTYVLSMNDPDKREISNLQAYNIFKDEGLLISHANIVGPMISPTTDLINRAMLSATGDEKTKADVVIQGVPVTIRNFTNSERKQEISAEYKGEKVYAENYFSLAQSILFNFFGIEEE